MSMSETTKGYREDDLKTEVPIIEIIMKPGAETSSFYRG